MSAARIDCLVNPGCSLGEGPLWDAGSERLYWVDILENRVYRHDPAAARTEAWTAPEHVGFVFPEPDGTLLAGLESGLHRLSLRADGTADAERIDRLDGGDGVRFNDATRDPDGRIWACTLGGSAERPLGAYHRYDADLRRGTVDEGYLVANGPALSPDGGVLYTVETSGHPARRKGVYAAPLDPAGALGEQRLLIGWDGYQSSPDGVVVDADGDLWLGEFGGNVLRRFDASGALRESIPLPAWNPTKPALADGVLYVTSARVGIGEETLARYPDTGGVLRVAHLGSGR